MNFDLRLVSLVVLFVAVIVIQAAPLIDEDEIKNSLKCSQLCQHCGCMGFYCGEECICECSKESDEDVNCVSTMHSNCIKMKLPFEVLLQGPSGNRFIRRAYRLDANAMNLREEQRPKRSTIVIYRPTEGQNTVELLTEINNIENPTRVKRNVDEDEIGELEKPKFGAKLFQRQESSSKFDEKFAAARDKIRERVQAKGFKTNEALAHSFKSREPFLGNAKTVNFDKDRLKTGWEELKSKITSRDFFQKS